MQTAYKPQLGQSERSADLGIRPTHMAMWVTVYSYLAAAM